MHKVTVAAIHGFVMTSVYGAIQCTIKFAAIDKITLRHCFKKNDVKRSAFSQETHNMFMHFSNLLENMLEMCLPLRTADSWRHLGGLPTLSSPFKAVQHRRLLQIRPNLLAQLLLIKVLQINKPSTATDCRL